jgi:hypothetical protein
MRLKTTARRKDQLARAIHISKFGCGAEHTRDHNHIDQLYLLRTSLLGTLADLQENKHILQLHAARHTCIDPPTDLSAGPFAGRGFKNRAPKGVFLLVVAWNGAEMGSASGRHCMFAVHSASP